MEKFNFISDDLFRQTLINDYTELEKGINNSCYKSVLILAGSIIEAILIDYLISLDLKDVSKEKLLKYDLNDAITKCVELKIISNKTKNFSDAVRDYRNLIHPGKAIRTMSIPNEDDAVIAKSLVQIIIKEVGEKKQESYGFTAEQILSKIESDNTSEVIWHHFIKKINTQEKRRLLLKVITERYFAIFNNNDYYEKYPEETLTNLGKFFKAIYSSIDNNLKNEVAKKFLSVLHEGSSTEVSHHIESFFVINYFEQFTVDDKTLVKDHLFGFIKTEINKKIADSLKGISKYLTEKEYEQLVSILFNKAINTNNALESDQAKFLLDNEHQSTSEINRQFAIKFIENKKKYYSYNKNYATKAEEILDYLNGLPF